MKSTGGQVADRIREGSERAFTEFYDACFEQLSRYSYHIVMCEESRDIVHNVFAKLWENRAKIPHGVNLRSYLYATVRNESLNYLRRLDIEDRCHRKAAQAMLFVEEQWHDQDEPLYEQMLRSIDRLPGGQAQIVRLKLQGHSYEQIAAMLGIAKSTVNNQVVKAYKWLRVNALMFAALLGAFMGK